MKIYYILLTVIISALTVPVTFASDPQLFIYRNDGGFNATHLRNGVSVSHSIASDGFVMHLLDDDSKTADIPVSAIDSCVVRVSDIPTLHLSLPDYPDVTDLWDKEMYLNCVLDIEGNGYCDDSETLTLTVRGRGNSTWSMPKKPMRLKFAKKISLFGLAKQKNYVLLANYIDETLMKNAVAYWIARRLGVPYANHTVPVNVEINGSPRGSYLLTEKVGINSGSVDIDETKGILFELSTEFDEPFKFRSDLWNLPVMVKDPDLSEIAEDNPDGPSADELLEMWKNDFNRAVRLANAGKGAEAFDMESLVRVFLLYNICLNDEIGFPKSFYIHKEALGPQSLYKLGPAWDFDVAFNFRKSTVDGKFEEASPQGKLWVNALLGALSVTPGFMTMYKNELRRFAADDFPELLDFIRDYAMLIDPSSKMDAMIWPEVQNGVWYERRPASDVVNQAEKLGRWLGERMACLLERAEKSEL